MRISCAIAGNRPKPGDLIQYVGTLSEEQMGNIVSLMTPAQRQRWDAFAQERALIEGGKNIFGGAASAGWRLVFAPGGAGA
jgi:hypothetical protein